MQMIIQLFTEHYDSHLGNNDGKQVDNNINIKRIGCITPY